MREQVTMPRLGETVSEGTVTRWLRKVGDTVAPDEPLLEIQTDKVSMEVPTLTGGVLAEVLVDEGQTVPVGAPLAWLETGVEGPALAGTPPVQDVATMVTEAPLTRAAAGTEAEPAGGGRPSPLIRRLLAEAGLSSTDVTGTGPAGRILREDVAAAASARAADVSAPPRPQGTAAMTPRPAAPRPRSQSASPSPPPQPAPSAAPPAAPGGHSTPLSPLRTIIAERMVASLQTSAQLTSVIEVDVSRIAELRRRAATAPALDGVKLSFLPFFVRAVVATLASHPDINASIDTLRGTVTHHDSVHLAVAVDTDAGLLAPVIRNAERLSVVGLVHAIADVANRARGRTLGPDDLAGGTFTITNTGSRGALFDTPIINQPQVAILATGAVVRRPIVVSDATTGAEGIAIRSMAYLALTYDHRLVDGAAAAAFLVDVRRRLEDGGFAADLGLAES